MKDLDIASKMLLVLDEFIVNLSSKKRKYISDYFDLFTAINSQTFRMSDGTFATAFRLDGFVALLSESEKMEKATDLSRKLDGFLSTQGYCLQIVDWFDPEITERKIRRMLKDSVEELSNIGLDGKIFNEDYIKFIASKALWKEQFLILMTRPSVVDSTKVPEGNKEDIARKEDFLRSVLKVHAEEQGMLLAEPEQIQLAQHASFCKVANDAFSSIGSLIQIMPCSQFLAAQSEMLWSTKSDEDWVPNLSKTYIHKKSHLPEWDVTKLSQRNVPDQVLQHGAQMQPKRIDVVAMGGRYFSTINMTSPQSSSTNLHSYDSMFGRPSRGAGYIVSFIMESDPFSNKEVINNLWMSRICSILPLTSNSEIKRSIEQLMDLHQKKNVKSVYLQTTVTMYAKSIDDVDSGMETLKKRIRGAGGAEFSHVELEPLDGVFSSLPAASASSRLTSIIEFASVAFFMSPVFTDCQLYKNGYLTLFTENLRPFPLEEHSSKNINFNASTYGASGTGKSTLLSMQNIGFIAKPKLFTQMKGELPLTFSLDFGKTSFGLNETMFEQLMLKFKETNNSIYKLKAQQILSHVMSVGRDSAWNPHDLLIGRTRPTDIHRSLLTNFIMMLFFGVDVSKTKDGDITYVQRSQDMRFCVENMIDAVYAYRDVGSKPFTFKLSEFSVYAHHAVIVELWKKIGVIPSDLNGESLDSVLRNSSYYELATDMMIKANATGSKELIRNATFFSKIVRRFAYPRMTDYVDVSTQRENLVTQFGQTKIKALQDGVTQCVQRYPCFSGVTRIPIDNARVISIDIESVVAEDPERKAIFGTMGFLMFMLRRENSENSTDMFLGYVDPVFRPHLERFNETNLKLPAIFNLEEAHVLLKLMDETLCQYQRVNRRANWGIKAFTQSLSHPSEDFLSLCSSVWFTSNMPFDERLTKVLRLPDKSADYIQNGIGDDPTSFFVIVRTKSDSVSSANSDANTKQNPQLSIPLKLFLPAGFLWATNVDATDREFKKQSIAQFGFNDGMTKLSVCFPSGKVKHLLENSDLKNAINKYSSYPDVMSFLFSYMSSQVRPDWVPHELLRG